MDKHQVVITAFNGTQQLAFRRFRLLQSHEESNWHAIHSDKRYRNLNQQKNTNDYSYSEQLLLKNRRFAILKSSSK